MQVKCALLAYSSLSSSVFCKKVQKGEQRKEYYMCSSHAPVTLELAVLGGTHVKLACANVARRRSRMGGEWPHENAWARRHIARAHKETEGAN